MNIDTLILFDNYYKNLLSEKEKCNFEHNLNTDSDFRKEYERYSILIDGITIYERERLKNILKTTVSDSKETTPRIIHYKRFSSMRIAYAVAATILILLLPSYFIYQKATFSNRMYNKYYVEDPGLPVVMGLASNNIFNNAMIDYKEARYNNALMLFNQLLSENLRNDTLNFYSGLCYMKTNNSEKSIDMFIEVTKIPDSRFYILANYYLGLSYIKIKNYVAAKSSLTKVSDSMHYLSIKAKAMIHDIE